MLYCILTVFISGMKLPGVPSESPRWVFVQRPSQIVQRTEQHLRLLDRTTESWSYHRHHDPTWLHQRVSLPFANQQRRLSSNDCWCTKVTKKNFNSIYSKANIKFEIWFGFIEQSKLLSRNLKQRLQALLVMSWTGTTITTSPL